MVLRQAPRPALLGLLLFCSGACYRLDTERHPAQRESLGREVYRILKQDLDRLQPAKGRALEREGARFVRGVDTLLPDEQLDDIQNYLVQILPLFDSGLAVALIRNLACLCREISTAQPALLAWWRHFRPEGYGREPTGVLLRRLLHYPQLRALLAGLARLYLAHDGLDEEYRPATEDDTLSRLLRETAGWMRRTEADIVAGSWPEALVDFLLREDSRLHGETLWLVRSDLRGRARPALDPRTGALLQPFVDADGDGLADIDPESGDFVDGIGRPLDVPAPFSADGRRAQREGYFVYRYVDLGASLLGALLKQPASLVGDGLLGQLAEAGSVLLGPEKILSDGRGSYPGHLPEDSPLFALGHALLALADYPRAPELLEAMRLTLELREPQLARLLFELDQALDIVDAFPAALSRNNRLLDDLVERLREIAARGYLTPLLKSFADPRARALGAGLAAMVRYRDHLDDQRPGGMVFSRLTDFSLSDADYANRSNFQRMLHLVYDTNGAAHRVTVVGFDVFVIPDMLAFWLDSAADSGRPGEGLARVPWYVVTAVREFDTEYPPAEQVNRFINHDHDILGNPRGKEGRELLDYNGESLLALEVSGLLNGLRPLITALASRDRQLPRPGTKFLADFLAALHPHVSTNPPGASPACAGLVRLQPMLLDILENTRLVDALVDILGSLSGVTGSSGREVIDEFAGFLTWLLEPDPKLRRHDGADTILAADRSTALKPFSRLYLLLDALRYLDDAADADPRGRKALEDLGDSLYRHLLAPEEIAGIYRIKNRQAWVFLLNALDFLGRRLDGFRARGMLSAETSRLEDKFRGALGGRLTGPLMKALNIVQADREVARWLDGLLLHLLDGASPEWPRVLLATAWLLQDIVSDPLTLPWLHLLADYLDPQAAGRVFGPGAGCRLDGNNLLPSRLMRTLLALSLPTVGGVDVFSNLLRNAGRLAAEPDGFPLVDFKQVLCAAHRAEPDHVGELRPGDFSSVIFEIGDYLTDERRGIEKLYQMIARRFGLPAP